MGKALQSPADIRAPAPRQEEVAEGLEKLEEEKAGRQRKVPGRSKINWCVRSCHLPRDGWDSVGTFMALQHTSPHSSLVVQPKNQVAGMFIPQESGDITAVKLCQHPTFLLVQARGKSVGEDAQH